MYVHVKVIPDAKKEAVLQKDKTHFAISVREPAERNLANKRVLNNIANQFNVVQSKVRIITGHHSPSKILDIDLS